MVSWCWSLMLSRLALTSSSTLADLAGSLSRTSPQGKCQEGVNDLLSRFGAPETMVISATIVALATKHLRIFIIDIVSTFFCLFTHSIWLSFDLSKFRWYTICSYVFLTVGWQLGWLDRSRIWFINEVKWNEIQLFNRSMDRRLVTRMIMITMLAKLLETANWDCQTLALPPYICDSVNNLVRAYNAWLRSLVRTLSASFDVQQQKFCQFCAFSQTQSHILATHYALR